MKTTTTNQNPDTFKIVTIGHQYKLVSSNPDTKDQKFKSCLELVTYLNKHRIGISNREHLPPFYQFMLKS